MNILNDPNSSTFAGVEMSQAWQDLSLWESYLNIMKPKSLIELGTYKGGMSCFLKCQSLIRGFKFSTFDINSRLDKIAGEFIRDNFIMGDVLEEDINDVRCTIRTSEKPLVLFCDNGNKKKEIAIYYDSLSVGDGLVVHDWNHDGEVRPGHVEGLMLDTILREECDSINSITRFFIKRGTE